MSKTSWGAAVPDAEAHRRAAGRRRYNREREVDRQIRLVEVLRLVRLYGLGYGVQARIARQLGVSDATISRDIKYLFFMHRACPTCEHLHPIDHWSALAARRSKTGAVRWDETDFERAVRTAPKAGWIDAGPYDEVSR